MYRGRITEISVLASLFLTGSLLVCQTISTPRVQNEAPGTVTDPEVVGILKAYEGARSSGLLLDGLLADWHATGDGRLFRLVAESVKKNHGEAEGEALVALYRITQDRTYFVAAQGIRDSVKRRGESTVEPCKEAEISRFLALYGVTFQDSEATSQAVNAEMGLLRAAKQRPQDEVCSVRAAVELTEIVPVRERKGLKEAAVIALDHLQKNSLSRENAASKLMAVYALAKGTRLGLAPLSTMGTAVSSWNTISASQLEQLDEARDDAYLLAHSEMLQQSEAGGLLKLALGKSVLFDGWYNRQFRKDAEGRDELFHYKANDYADSGYSTWAAMFEQYGMTTSTLEQAPTASDLTGASVYVIASPEPEGSKTDVHLMDSRAALAVSDWVNAGGVLVVMQNDNRHADQVSFNQLTDPFGLHFNATMRNAETKEAGYASTLVKVPAEAGGIFLASHTTLLKETCTITVSAPAQSVASKEGDVMMAFAHVGKGTVFAATDPWLYNEYTDGRKAPLQEDNFAAAQELTRWLVQQSGRR